jgi:hypothetical protein
MMTSAPASLLLALGANASDGERYAAARFQSLVREMVQNQSCLPMVTPREAAGRAQVAIGSEASVALLPSLASELEGLGDEGFILRTEPGGSTSIAITGARSAPRGSLYGVHRLLESAGFEFLSSNATLLPSPSAYLWAGAVSVRETPAFAWRHSNNANIELQEHVNFSVALADNNDGGERAYTGHDMRKPGGGIRWADPPGFVHTSSVLVPPTTYQPLHPEWFSNATAAAGHPAHGHQLCWANRSLLQFVARRAVDLLAQQPGANAISISQNDGTGTDGHTDPCKRPADAAVYEQEGEAWSGPLLRGVNYVADAIAAAFPRRRILVTTCIRRHESNACALYILASPPQDVSELRPPRSAQARIPLLSQATKARSATPKRAGPSRPDRVRLGHTDCCGEHARERRLPIRPEWLGSAGNWRVQPLSLGVDLYDDLRQRCAALA